MMQRQFLEALGRNPNVLAACKAAGVSRNTVYRWRKNEPEFGIAWDNAMAGQVAAVTPAATVDVDVTVPASVATALSGERPRYRLTEYAYIDDILHQPGTAITFDGTPGHHMHALNDAAKLMKGLQPGALDVSGVDAAQEVLNEASLRLFTVQSELDAATARRLLALGREMNAGVSGEAALLLHVIKQKEDAIRDLKPTIATAQANVDSAEAVAKAKRGEQIVAAMIPALARRLELSAQVANAISVVSSCLRQISQLGETSWLQIRQTFDERHAASCVPDENAVARALVGALLGQDGLSFDSINRLSQTGVEQLRSHESIEVIVQRQNEALLAKFV